MPKITLFTTTQTILYEGNHADITSAIEFCIQNNIPLNAIDLSFQKIYPINLDGVCIQGASFRETDLTGANMSEAKFTDCDFSGATLIDVCLCYTDLVRCNFKYTTFGHTDISMASLDSCAFEGWSALSLDFHTAFKLTELTYTHHQDVCPFYSPPTLIHHQGQQIAVFDTKAIYREKPHTLERENTPESIYTPKKHGTIYG